MEAGFALKLVIVEAVFTVMVAVAVTGAPVVGVMVSV
jgi:hypothetical protein